VDGRAIEPIWSFMMHGRLRTAARFVDTRVGWSRVGFVLSVAVITAAAVVLYQVLRDIRVADVLDALRDIETPNIIIAALFVAAGYLTLTFYDLFALRTIGQKDVPYRIAVLAAFTSYAIGHNLGASVFTGGAVRYRIYSAYGLSGIDVAKLCFITGLTFWLGNATVLGLGLLVVPGAASSVDQLPPWANRVIAIASLIVLFAYLSWVWRTPRVAGRSNWEVKLPSGPLTLLQILIGIIDLSCCAFAMYMLLPDDPSIGFVALAVIFVSATLLGFASHSPGGLGVFDAAMLIGLWQYDKEDVVAGLLLFRLLYYVIPFAFALVILGAREVWFNLAPPRAIANVVHAKHEFKESTVADPSDVS
jgi:glycosyltransferase 2 family protein